MRKRFTHCFRIVLKALLLLESVGVCNKDFLLGEETKKESYRSGSPRGELSVRAVTDIEVNTDCG